MQIHKEGRKILVTWLIIAVILALTIQWIISLPLWLHVALDTGLLLLTALFLWFFRIPNRPFPTGDGLVSCPVDGKVVVIEKVYEGEYFHEPRIQVSIFMSFFNPHVNFVPMDGKVIYLKYHPGDYFFAFHPKSSALNERTTIAIEGEHGSLIMRQIAGAVARRIVWFCKVDDNLNAGDEIGFIKFGSRIDLLLPEESDIAVTVGQKVKAGACLVAALRKGTKTED